MLAPRGDILDRNGKVLVDNRTSLALQVNPQKLPANAAEERAELKQLGELAQCRCRGARTIREQEKVAAGALITLRRDVGYDLVYYIEREPAQLPGVSVQNAFVRTSATAAAPLTS